MDKKPIKIGIDLDNCITADKNSRAFFRILTHLLNPEYRIQIITNRDAASWKETSEELKELGIQYYKIVFTADKASYVLKHKINIYFDDTDEYFLELPETVTVFKIRESGNFDFKTHKWVMSSRNAEMIDEDEKSDKKH